MTIWHDESETPLWTSHSSQATVKNLNIAQIHCFILYLKLQGYYRIAFGSWWLSALRGLLMDCTIISWQFQKHAKMEYFEKSLTSVVEKLVSNQFLFDPFWQFLSNGNNYKSGWQFLNLNCAWLLTRLALQKLNGRTCP